MSIGEHTPINLPTRNMSFPHFRKRVRVEEQRAQNSDRFLRGRKFLTWSTSSSVQPGLLKRYKDAQSWSIFACRTTTSKISTFDGMKLYYQPATCLQMWFWKDCTSPNYRTLFSLRLSWLCTTQETVRNSGQTSFLQLKTSVNFEIDQMMRTRNFRVQNEVVERGAVTNSSKGKKAYECFQWKAHGQCSKETHVVSVMTN